MRYSVAFASEVDSWKQEWLNRLDSMPRGFTTRSY